MNAHPLVIGDLFRRNARVVPHRVAASLGQEQLTHGELDDAANRLAWALHGMGLRRGDRVVSWADTSLSVLPLFAALTRLGAVFAPLNARLGADEAGDVAQLARGAMLVVDEARAADAAQVASKAGITWVAQLEGGADALHPVLDPTHFEDAGEYFDAEIDETDPHVIFFTSGSTGRPKGVVLSHRANYLRSFQGIFKDEPEKTVCMFPLFHMAAFTLAMSAWQTRGEIAFVRNATAEEILGAVVRRSANRIYCIPLVWNRILELDTDVYDLSSLKQLDTGTSATPIELIRALKERFPGTVTRIYYGSTEVGAATSVSDADVLRKPGSVGPASPGVDVELTDEGEIRVRCAYMMDGYFDDPKTTDEAIRDGWFYTGDLGAFDDEGYLSIVGRKKEVIRSGGESVSPTEVEAALADAPGVSEIAIVGVPDLDWGEVVCAVVVAGEGEPPTLDGIHAHAQGRLAGFKKPRRLFLTHALPRTAATGQIQRALIVEEIQTSTLEEV